MELSIVDENPADKIELKLQTVATNTRNVPESMNIRRTDKVSPQFSTQM